LQKVLDGQLPVNHAILGNLQDVFNLLPNLSTPEGNAKGGSGDLAYAMGVKTNDQLMAIYLSSLIRAITAFHDLIENKIQNRQQQQQDDKEPKKDENETKDENKEGTSGGVNGDVKDIGDKQKDVKDRKK